MNERIRAPELDSELGWLNTDRPLRFSHELKGQVVVLDFWTYCCMNCMHILPDLAYLEDKYRNDPVTLIGVHSAKFSNEASRATIRAAMLRYEIRHPVVIDDNMKLWRAFAVRSWPTQVVIDPKGYVIGSAAGEGNRDLIDRTIEEALLSGRSEGNLADGPPTFRLEASVRATSGLKFPGKVLADAEGGRLYVADSNHNRIVIAELPGPDGRANVIKVVGSGHVGPNDGPADEATFNHPQGLTAAHGSLYVADTENHLIRAIDLATFEVRTLIGTGEMSNDRAGGAMGTAQGINSPWDLTVEGGTLYCAMAGAHQIWRIDLPVGFARAFAGSGRENIVDGPTESAALAQPSGICLLGGNLYFSDSEVSAIRGIEMTAERVFTIIGQGLFSFGDVDGQQPEARLQHPLGIAAWNNALLVADTYNHKIKIVDPAQQTVHTLYGTGRPGTASEEGGAAFFEPGGLSVAGDMLYVADTNNHRVVAVNLTTNEWHEVAFEGLEPPRAAEAPAAQALSAEAVSIEAGKDLDLVLDIRLPANAHINPEAPWSVRVQRDGRTLVQQTGKSDRLPIQVRIPAHSVPTGGTWHIEASLAYCTQADQGLCAPISLAWTLPVKPGGSMTKIVLPATIDDRVPAGT